MRNSMAGFHSPKHRAVARGISIRSPTPMIIFPVYRKMTLKSLSRGRIITFPSGALT